MWGVFVDGDYFLDGWGKPQAHVNVVEALCKACNSIDGKCTNFSTKMWFYTSHALEQWSSTFPDAKQARDTFLTDLRNWRVVSNALSVSDASDKASREGAVAVALTLQATILDSRGSGLQGYCIFSRNRSLEPLIRHLHALGKTVIVAVFADDEVPRELTAYAPSCVEGDGVARLQAVRAATSGTDTLKKVLLPVWGTLDAQRRPPPLPDFPDPFSPNMGNGELAAPSPEVGTAQISPSVPQVSMGPAPYSGATLPPQVSMAQTAPSPTAQQHVHATTTVEAPKPNEPNALTTLPPGCTMHFDAEYKKYYYAIRDSSSDVSTVWEHPLGSKHQIAVDAQVEAWIAKTVETPPQRPPVAPPKTMGVAVAVDTPTSVTLHRQADPAPVILPATSVTPTPAVAPPRLSHVMPQGSLTAPAPTLQPAQSPPQPQQHRPTVAGISVPTGRGTVLVLPHGWEQRTTPEGRVFFVSHTTRATSWTPPVDSEELPSGWSWGVDPQAQRKFYIDSNSRQTTWVKPSLQ